MTTEVVVAIVSAVSIIFSAVISAVVSNKLIEWRLKEVEKKLDLHNGYAEKFSSVTTEIKLMQKDIKYIKESLEKR